MTINELAKIMKDNGISGAGGAGFPAYAKLNEKADTVLLNCAECEPLLKVHRQVLKFHAFEILKALHLIAQTVGAKNCIVAMKESYKTTLATVKAELEAFPNIKIGILPEVYPAGDEVVLIYETTGKVVPPPQAFPSRWAALCITSKPFIMCIKRCSNKSPSHINT